MRGGRQWKLATLTIVHRAVVLFLFLWGCAPHPSSSPESLYHDAKKLLKEGKLKDALATADLGFRSEPSWRFRLLKAEVLLSINPEEALKVLETGEPPDAPEVRARVQLYRGWAKFRLAEYPEAEAALNRAREIAAPLPLPELKAEIELRRGSLLAQQGRNDAADESFRNVIGEGDLEMQARAMGSLGVFFLKTHREDEAIYWLEKYREASERIGSATSLANALGNLGSAYYRLGDFDKALHYLTEAEARCRDTGNRNDQQAWLGNIGNVFLDRDEFLPAIEKYKRALEIARDLGDKDWIGWWLNNLALASIKLGDFDAAEKYNIEALRLKQNLPDRSDFYPRVNEAQIAAGRKDYTHAEKLYRGLLAESSDDPTPRLEAEAGLAKLLVETKQFDRADTQFRSAIQIVEHRRAELTREEYKLSHLSSLIRFYQQYVDFLVTRGETAKALEVAESSRARLLDEKLRADSKVDRAVSAAALEQVARSSGSVLLSYWLAKKRSFLWVITPAGITLHVLPPERQIEALVSGYRNYVEDLNDPLASEYRGGRKLSEILLGPVRPLLAAGARAIVVPDRALHSLNLETLPDPGNSSQYLIERVTVAVAPSLGLLAEARKSSQAARSILLIGNPEPAVEEYPRLPYAAQEMDSIQQKFPADRRVVMEGARAYAAAYREAEPARFSWIHFAAHATANRENPLDSALILSRHDSGYTLSARDLMNIGLNADLVTLSACRSAGAKTYSGEGLVGLSWAFLRAGARSVVAGLWDVSDRSTARLMADFYGELSRDVPATDALRQAKLNLVHSKGAFRQPFYWGPFQLYVGAPVGTSSQSRDTGNVRHKTGGF